MKSYAIRILLAALFLFLSSCSNVATLLKERELKVDLEYADALILQNKYEAAMSEFERLSKRHPQSPFSDKIIFNIGLLYLHPDNLKRDVSKGINILEGLIKKYPNSRYTLYARPLMLYSKEGIEQKAEIERLKGEIEKFKELQIQLEKREKEFKK
ncbi:MAG: outer membrane protein assembly factor BamD [Nitrospirae bacterium]|nr:outer membrane protein assembly factor BamD [Nitrospirota bacterium]